MPSFGLVLRVSLPERLRRYGYFDVGRHHAYFDEEAARGRMRRLARRGLPAVVGLLSVLARRPRLSVGFSVSGPVLERAGAETPEFLENLRRLATHPRVALVGESSHHTLAHLACSAELDAQVALQSQRLRAWCGKAPSVFRNAFLLHSAAVGAVLERRGFESALVDPGSRIPGSRAVLIRSLSPDGGDAPVSCARLPVDRIALPASRRRPAGAGVDSPLQRDALGALFALREGVLADGREDLLDDFRRLSNADRFAAMAADGSGACFRAAGDSPFEAYVAFRYAVRDLEARLGGRRLAEGAASGDA